MLAALFLAATGLIASATTAVQAETVSGLLLSGSRVAERGACAIVRIEFNGRMSYLNHFPMTSGDELRIQLKPLSAGAGLARAVVAREALRAPSNPSAAIHGIELEPGPQGAVLTVHFRRTMAYRVAPGADLQSLIIAVAAPTAAAGCEPVFPDTPLVAQDAKTPPASRPAAGAAPLAAEAPATSDPAQLLIQARAGMARNEVDKAVQLLTKILETSGAKQAADAKELLGLARERKGQLAHAKADYREYLQHYPQGDGVERIKQRLAVMESGDQKALAQLRKQADRIEGDVDGGSGRIAGRIVDGPVKDPNAWAVSQWGSVSANYNLNQGKRDQFAAPLLQQGWNRDSTYQVYLNSVLSNLDYNADFEKAGFAGRINFSGSQQSNFTTEQHDAVRVSSLYVDGRWLQSGVTARVGRQNQFGNGVLGRFDGLHASYQPSETFKLHAVAGSPVEWSYDSPFATQRYFYGAGIELPQLRKGFDTSLYVVEQRDGQIIDRQAIGLEGRFTGANLTGHSALEYDTHFGSFNSALLSGTKINGDQSSWSGTLDYRRAPSLFTANALFGQPFTKLSDMLKQYGASELGRLAWDRTAESYAASLAYSRPLNERLQVNLDGTILHVSGTPASGGVEASPASGIDYYTSAQLVASNVLREGDTVSGGVRYSVTQFDTRTQLELGARYPVAKDWRINPMLRFGYVDYTTKPWSEYQVIPSIRTSYYLMKDVALELEIGNRWIMRNTPAGQHNETELMIMTGVRYDFRTGK
jgi:tetratricopeptide (TPR) repeat protein